MSINKKQIKKLADWIESKAPDLKCVACGSNDWSAQDIVATPTWDVDETKNTRSTVPMVQLICKNCAYVIFFSAEAISLKVKERPADKKQ